MAKTETQKSAEAYRKTRKDYLQKRVSETQDSLRTSGLSDKRKKKLQEQLKTFKDNLTKIKEQSNLKETKMAKQSLKDQYRKSTTAAPGSTKGNGKPQSKRNNPSQGKRPSPKPSPKLVVNDNHTREEEPISLQRAVLDAWAGDESAAKILYNNNINLSDITKERANGTNRWDVVKEIEKSIGHKFNPNAKNAPGLTRALKSYTAKPDHKGYAGGGGDDTGRNPVFSPKATPATKKPATNKPATNKPAKPAAKKATPAKTSKASKDADIKAITNLEDKFNNNLKASGPRDPKVKALQKELIERKEKFNDTYKSAKPFYYLAEPVKAGSTPLDKLKSLYLEIENTRNDKTRERLVKQADSIEKKLSPADAKKAKQLLADNDKSRRDELNKKISSKPSAKKDAGSDPKTGKRYTKRGVTQMLKQLREQQESGRKTSNAYKQREEDIKRLTKVLKTLSSTNPKIALADQHRISVIANSLEVVTANTVWGTGATYDELAKALKKLGIKGVTADGLESDFDEGDGVTSGSEPVYKYFDKVLGEDDSQELAEADGAFVFATLYIAGLLGKNELKTVVPNANIRKMILSCN